MKLRYEAHMMDGTLFDERKEGNELEVVIEEGAPSNRDHFFTENDVHISLQPCNKTKRVYVHVGHSLS